MCLKKAVLLDLSQGRRGPSSKLYTVFGVGIMWVSFFLTENNINTHHIYVILIISLCNILRFKGPI